jgi:cytochrome c oxidase subunit 2
MKKLSILILVAALAGCASIPLNDSALKGMPADAPIQKVSMTAEKYDFSPEEIRVKQGTRLVIEIESLGSKHELKLKDFGIHVDIPSGEKVTVELYTGEPGTYKFGCHLGLGFHYVFGMKGRIIVE